MAGLKGWVIEENSFPKKGKIEEQLEFLIRYAVLAPNSHNTQPWKFKIEKNKIIIFPDYSKKLKIIDKNNRELWISLGCALENLLLSGRNFGFNIKIKTDEEKIIVSFTKGKVIKDNLFEQITKRVTNKRKAKRILIKPEILQDLKRTRFEKGTNAFLLEDKEDIEKVIELVKEGNDILLKDPNFIKESINLMRFNLSEVNKYKDGLTYKSMDMPSTPAGFGKIVTTMFLKPKYVNKEDEEKLRNSSGIIIITSTSDEKKDWVKVGKTTQKLLLKLTSLGISYSFLNQPCEISKLRKKLQKITKEFPQLIIRIGYAKDISHAPRKEIGEVLEIVQNKNKK
ncbi:hypothetical protein GW932_03525 [archaeon]|nr:hypothetical protein [archaeon]